MRYYITIIIGLLVYSCTVDQEHYSFEESVDSEVIPYLLSFEEEAEKRGRTVDWEEYRMEIRLTDIDDDAVGRCLTYTNQTRRIELDLNYWSEQGEVDKEFVIFHELGHCILNRSHLDEADTAGRCLSIMHSSNELCRNNYNLRTRDEFLDELFL